MDITMHLTIMDKAIPECIATQRNPSEMLIMTFLWIHEII